MVNGNDNSRFVAGVFHRLTEAEFAVNQACTSAAVQQAERGEKVVGANADSVCHSTGYNMGVVQPALQKLNNLRILNRKTVDDGTSELPWTRTLVHYRPNPNALVIAKTGD